MSSNDNGGALGSPDDTRLRDTPAWMRVFVNDKEVVCPQFSRMGLVLMDDVDETTFEVRILFEFSDSDKIGMIQVMVVKVGENHFNFQNPSHSLKEQLQKITKVVEGNELLTWAALVDDPEGIEIIEDMEIKRKTEKKWKWVRPLVVYGLGVVGILLLSMGIWITTTTMEVITASIAVDRHDDLTIEVKPGQSLTWKIKPGQKVQKGGIIGEIRDIELQTQLPVLEAAIEEEKARLQLLEARQEGVKKLRKSKAASDVELLEANALVAESKAKIKGLESKLRGAEELVANLKITSPCDCVVFSRGVDRGTVMVRLYPQNAPIFIEATIPQNEMGNIQEGGQANYTLVLSGEEYEAKVIPMGALEARTSPTVGLEEGRKGDSSVRVIRLKPVSSLTDYTLIGNDIRVIIKTNSFYPLLKRVWMALSWW
ncbi:MAG: hypothetical protein H6767_00105 [Candidatus Peribacteria bacterium]|nr:MAG: hypothetical protein H6767_00105 [Candidatus Peribacteria bacterium]